MEMFKKCDEKYEAAAEQYKKPREAAYISLPILLNGRTYREIVYYKTSFGRVKKEIQGVVFVNEDGTLVSDQKEKKDIAEVSCKLEKILCAYDGNIKRAVINNEEYEKERRDYDLIIRAFDRLKREGIHGTDEVKDILIKLPDVKIESNEAIKRLSEKIAEIENETVLDVQLIEGIDTYYINSMMANFKKVKLINNGKYYYDDLLKASINRMRRVEYRTMGSGIAEGLRKLEYAIHYLKNMVVIYNKIIDMTEGQYMEFLKTIDKNTLKTKLGQIRN